MATLTLIGEPMPGAEAGMHAAAARDLTEAMARVAPRGCSARLLVAHDSETPEFTSPRARVETLPMRAGLLPLLWRVGATARPLDDEFVHALTPLVPLRARRGDDTTQTSVTVPHALAWLAPELMGVAEARQYRAYVKRALRFADAVLTPNHATADVLYEHFGPDLPVQVLPLAAPAPMGKPADAAAAAARRAALGLPARYVVTTAAAFAAGGALGAGSASASEAERSGAERSGSGADHGDASAAAPAAREAADTPMPSAAAVANDRLDWLLDALADSPELPDLVIVSDAPYAATLPATLPESLRHRVHVVRPETLADWGAVLSGALLLGLPQRQLGTGYEVLGALDAGVPVLHGGSAVAAELALDAGVAADDAAGFAAELARLTQTGATVSQADAAGAAGAAEHDALSEAETTPDLERLRVLAEDRSRAFGWPATAWQLWELHAGL